MSSQRRHVKAKKQPPTTTNAIEKKKVEPRPGQALLEKFALLAVNVENNVHSHASRLAEWEKIGAEVTFTAEGGVVKSARVDGLADLVSQVRDTMRDTTEAVTTCRQYVNGELYDLCDTTRNVITELELVVACQKSKMASQDEVIAAHEGIIQMMKSRDAKKDALIYAMRREQESFDQIIRSLENNIATSALQIGVRDQQIVLLNGQMKSLRGDFDLQKKMRLADKKELGRLRALCEKQDRELVQLRRGHDECPICFEVAHVRVMKPCGHTACDACADQLKHCHYCRAPVLSTVLLHPSPLYEG